MYRLGLPIGDFLLQNLRFADDVLLVGTSLKQIETMLTSLASEASKAGLELHQGKTKVLSNLKRRVGDNARSTLSVMGSTVEVLAIDSKTEYLGRILGFTDFHDSEIESRIGKGWKKCYLFRSELCCRDYPLEHRLRLFNGTVSPTVLYGSASWTMTKARENKLMVAQRRMLRKICQTKRREHTDWVEWLREATHVVREQMRAHDGECWVAAQRRRKWRWAGVVARMSDHRWTQRLVFWHPASGSRGVGRPCLRWRDVIDSFLQTIGDRGDMDWWLLAQDADAWGEYEEDFVGFSKEV